MKKSNLSFKPQSYLLIFFTVSCLTFLTRCSKNAETETLQAAPEVSTEAFSEARQSLSGFQEINLVANNNEYGAAHIDPALINAWGIAFSPGGTPWVAAQGGHVSAVYNSEGVTALGPVNITAPNTPQGGNPTGVVFNANAADFIIPSGNGAAPSAARFIFVGVDGVLSAWNPTWGTRTYLKVNNVVFAAYTGLTLATYNGNNYLYAADFRSGKIEVWDKNWNSVPLPFRDNRLPKGYAPFNIQSIGEYLYVTYAKVGPDGRDEKGVGKGFVNIYTTDGVLIERFAARGKLNAPWGVALAPPTFFPEGFDHADAQGADARAHPHKPILLVGNFGDGRINAYNQRGKFLGQLRTENGHVLEIEGLWALVFPPTTSTIDPNRLYFAAGPDEETHGLFGYLIKGSTSNNNSAN